MKNKLFLYASIPAMAVLLIAALQIGSILIMENSIFELKKADLIVVFPSENERVSAALTLAEEGYGANLAVINKTSQRLKKLTAKYKIPPEVHLITGGKSRSTFEDVFRTFQIIRKNKCSSLVLVTSSYHLPRSLFLLKTFLEISKMDVEIQYFPVNVKSYNKLKKMKLYYNETIKLWGSTVEMICYTVTKTFPADIEAFNRTVKFLRSYLLFKV